MAHCQIFALFISAVLLHAGAATAQDASRAPADGPPAEAARSSDVKATKAAFEERYEDWKQAVKQIELLRVEYQTADSARRQALQKELQTQFDAASEMVPGLVDAALEAFTASGGQDEHLTNFLVAVGWHRLRSDRYEEALEIIGPLVDAGAEQASLRMWAGVAAFSVADYDAAREYFEQAEEAGEFESPPPAEQKHVGEVWQLAAEFRHVIDEHEEAWQKEQAIRAEEAAADDLPRVELQTTKGTIVLELFENEAPNTVKNFITLVEKGVYDGTAFHRVLPNFMAQGGNPTTADKPPLGYTIPCECYQPDARKHFRGSLSMAHAGRDTGSAQFFLTFRPVPHLDGQTFHPQSPNDAHTVFGRVIEGMDVLSEINRIDPAAPPQVQAAHPDPDRITTARVLRKRPGTEYGEFETVTR